MNREPTRGGDDSEISGSDCGGPLFEAGRQVTDQALAAWDDAEQNRRTVS